MVNGTEGYLVDEVEAGVCGRPELEYHLRYTSRWAKIELNRDRGRGRGLLVEESSVGFVVDLGGAPYIPPT